MCLHRCTHGKQTRSVLLVINCFALPTSLPLPSPSFPSSASLTFPQTETRVGTIGGQRQPGLVRLMLSAGADAMAATTPPGCNALWPSFALLCGGGGDLPLHLAAAVGSLDIVHMLLADYVDKVRSSHRATDTYRTSFDGSSRRF